MATDVDPVPLEKLMSKIDKDAFTVRLCDGNDLSFDSGSFDCILAIQCIEYIDVKK